MNKTSNYLVYVTTQEYNLTDRWGGCHITMAATHKNTGKALTEAVSSIANQSLQQTPWHPSDWEIKNWKGRYTMAINSKTLIKVADQLKEVGVENLVGPGNGKCPFHVTLPASVKSKEEAAQYAQQLSQKDWYLTVVEKKQPSCKWGGYALLGRV